MSDQPRPKGEAQGLRVDRQTAALVRRLNKLPPGARVAILFEVGEDGRRRWSLGHFVEEAGRG